MVMDASTGRPPTLIRRECIDSFHSGGLESWTGIRLKGGRDLQRRAEESSHDLPGTVPHIRAGTRPKVALSRVTGVATTLP